MQTKLILAALVCALIIVGVGRSAWAEDEPPLPVTHQHFNFVEGVLATSADGTSLGRAKNPPAVICSTQTTTAENVNTDCEGNAPHNETSIAVNPKNPDNQIGSANDYQLIVSGAAVQETAYSRAHVTFDGGQTWTMYPVPSSGYDFTGDPAVSFDASGTAYIATLGFNVSQGNGCCTNPDVLVSHSTDGGKTWIGPVRVASGTGSFGSVGIFNDKEYLTAWGNGNAIVTYTRFNSGIRGSYINSPIYASVTHDYGNTWSNPIEISGSADFCIGSSGDSRCDQDQGSTPVVAADGSIYVSFLSTGDLVEFRDLYLVVKVNPATGARVAGPYEVAGVVDGIHDYPIDAEGRQTYQDSQFRTWALGNIAADPKNAAHLAVVWSDMRNSSLPAPPDPYSATTNSDIIVSQSIDGGQTWSAPVSLSLSGDQFMPWAVYDASGLLRIGFFDRSYDPANHMYGYTLATEQSAAPLTFAYAQLTTALSDPTKNDRWFSGLTLNPNFPHPTSFLGDYSGTAADPTGGVVGLWTDMRLTTTFGTRTGATEDAFWGRSN